MRWSGKKIQKELIMIPLKPTEGLNGASGREKLYAW
jgi:hypothetical protein